MERIEGIFFHNDSCDIPKNYKRPKGLFKFIEDNVSGLFFKCMNENDLADKMAQVIEGGKALNEKLKQGLSTFVEERYSTTAITAKYKNYFENLLQQDKK